MDSATDQSPDDLLESLQLDPEPESVPEAVEAVPVEGAPPPTDEGPPPSDPALSATPEASTAPAVSAPVTPPDLTTYAPPPGGNPFTVSADGRKHPIEGATEYPTGIWFPKEVWQRQVQNNLIGDRNAWRQERARLEHRATQVEQAKSQKEVQAERALAAIDKIFNDPTGELFQQEYQNWQTRGPVLLAQSKLEAIQAERDALQAQVQERAEQEEEARLVPQMQQWLGDEVEKALLGESVKGLFEPPQAIALLKELWEHHRGAVFYEGQDRKIHLNTQALHDLVERRASWIRDARQGMQKVEAKKAANAAALAPTKPGPAAPVKAVTPSVKETPARDEAGKFTAQSRKERKQAARAMLDDLTLDDVA